MPHGDADKHTRSSALNASREMPFSNPWARCVMRIQGLRIKIRGWSESVLSGFIALSDLSSIIIIIGSWQR